LHLLRQSTSRYGAERLPSHRSRAAEQAAHGCP
jgi:hypothetical protein